MMLKTDTALLQQILKEVQTLTDRVNDIDNELDHDRHNIQNLTVNVSQLSEEVKQARKAVNMTSEKVKNKVADVVEPITQSTDKLTTQIKQKKMVVLKEETKKWWQKLIRR